ncbi:MAG TPA: PEP-CTERM sorting domain-containing protein [Steroidobacteraceae bacterium]|nr:PEP-CTERM sorting domain-containing protein [Steroidobacteraceae bacterium]
MKRIWTLLLALASGLAPSLAPAVIIYDDGAVHTINTPVTESVRVGDATTVQVISGGTITGDGSTTGFIETRGALSTERNTFEHRIYLEGNARVQGGLEGFGIARSLGGRLSITDNSIVDAGLTGTAIYGLGFSPGPGIPTTPTLRTSISGNARVNGNVETDGIIEISGNAFINGNLREVNSGIILFMSGGTISGNVITANNIDHIVSLTGGEILGNFGSGAALASTMDFSMQDGRIAGSWSVNSRNMNVDIRGGSIEGGMTFSDAAGAYATNSNIAFFGGAIDTSIGSWLLDFGPTNAIFNGPTCASNNTSFDIWGGQFGYTSAGLGMRLDQCATVDIYGTGLLYAGGLLTGTLADGSLLNLSVTEVSTWMGAIRLHDVSVPEPGTLGLFAMMLGGLVFARRRPVAVA